MAIVRSTFKVGDELPPELIAELDVAAKRPPVYDPECPPLTDDELSEFRRVADTTREEMRRISIEGGKRRRAAALGAVANK
ncbi:hypothetical protein FACS1894142_2850 [Spirochaetia bacterium]|nr:hypothetical protein FACS1894142_2850 [Spirochaetia bacterium]